MIRAGTALAILGTSPYGSGTVGGTGVVPVRAHLFAFSISNGAHVDASPYNSNWFTLVEPAVTDLGLMTLRVGTFNTDVQLGLEAMLVDATGVKLIMVLNKGGSYTDTSIEDYTVSHVPPASIYVLEGFNEVDNNSGSWGGDPAYFTNVTTRFNATVSWKAAHANPVVNALPLSTASVVSNYGATHSGHTLNLASGATYGTAHPYPINGNEPGLNVSSDITAVSPVWGGVGNRPVIVTEAGYHSAPNCTTPGYLVGGGVSELAQGKYLGRLYAEFFKYGISITCWYELFNDGADLTNGESNFGIVKSDGTTKAAYTVTKSLIALFRETTWTANGYAIGTAYIDENFTRTNQTEWGTCSTGADTGKTWVPDSSGEFSISSNHGLVIATSQARNVIGDVHTGDQEIYAEYRNLRASYSNLCRTYARYAAYNAAYSLDFNPGVSSQLTLNINASTSIAAQTNSAWATLTDPNIRLWVRKVGNDTHLRGKVWSQSGGSEPANWSIGGVYYGGETGSLANGKTAAWVDNNGSGQSIYLTRFKSSPITTTAGSMSALSAFTLTPLDYTLSGTLTNVKSQLTQKGDGSWWLMLWQTLSVYNETTKADISNATVSVTITLNSGGSRTWSSYTPSTGTGATSLGTGTAKTVSVPDELFIVKVV